jgi:hypothetical protein
VADTELTTIEVADTELTATEATDHGDVATARTTSEDETGSVAEERASVLDEEDIRDALPADLDAVGNGGPYKFPDNSRRRIPGIIYLVMAALALVAWFATRHGQPVLVNDGFVVAAILLAAVGVFSISSSWHMHVDETQALIEATKAVGFPVGHASAQQVWRGVRSRPTWRVLCYSAEDPPRRRGFVLVDAVDGHVVEHLVEDNPEEWQS